MIPQFCNFVKNAVKLIFHRVFYIPPLRKIKRSKRYFLRCQRPFALCVKTILYTIRHIVYTTKRLNSPLQKWNGTSCGFVYYDGEKSQKTHAKGDRKRTRAFSKT